MKLALAVEKADVQKSGSEGRQRGQTGLLPLRLLLAQKMHADAAWFSR